MPGAAGRIRASKVTSMFSYKNDAPVLHLPKVGYVGVYVPLMVLCDSVDADHIVSLATKVPDPWFTLTFVGNSSAREDADFIVATGTCPNVNEERDPFADPAVATVLPSLMVSLTLGAITKAIAHYAYHFDVPHLLSKPQGGFQHGIHSVLSSDDVTPYMASAILEIAIYGDIVFTK
jgi:hypothetical protein